MPQEYNPYRVVEPEDRSVLERNERARVNAERINKRTQPFEPEGHVTAVARGMNTINRALGRRPNPGAAGVQMYGDMKRAEDVSESVPRRQEPSMAGMGAGAGGAIGRALRPRQQGGPVLGSIHGGGGLGARWKQQNRDAQEAEFAARKRAADNVIERQRAVQSAGSLAPRAKGGPVKGKVVEESEEQHERERELLDELSELESKEKLKKRARGGPVIPTPKPIGDRKLHDKGPSYPKIAKSYVR